MMVAVGTTNRQESLGQSSSVGEITMQIYHGGRFAKFSSNVR